MENLRQTEETWICLNMPIYAKGKGGTSGFQAAPANAG